MRIITVVTAAAVVTGAALPTLSRAQTPAGDVEAGREAFTMECRACHAGAIAPTLRGVMTRNIAANQDFAGYSDALKAKSGQAWTDESMHAFLKAPTEFAPGVRMTKATPEEKTRADIIAYLKTLVPR